MAMATLSPRASMDEIKWVFDMTGFVLFPSVLSDADTAAMVAEVEETLAYRQVAGGGLPDGQRMAPGVHRRVPATHEQANPGTVEQPGYLNYLNFAGRCGELLDHPLLNVRAAAHPHIHTHTPTPTHTHPHTHHHRRPSTHPLTRARTHTRRTLAQRESEGEGGGKCAPHRCLRSR